MSNIVIDLGHVGYSSGSVANGFREDFLNESIGVYAAEDLRRNGVNVTITTGSLENRVQVANSINAELFISVHNNSGGGDGTEILKYEGSVKGAELAQNILNEITGANLNNSRGLKNRNDLYVISKTNMPAVIVECAFMDTNDIQSVDSEEERKAFGVAISKGIIKTLGLQYKEVQQPQPGGTGWRVCIGYYEVYENAVKAVEDAKAAGFDAYMVPYTK
jgi:N-acetylmuramoyl-L-alanine amidase